MSTIMPPERTTYALLFSAGEIQALLMACQAMARAHPDPAKLTAELRAALQVGLAQFGTMPAAGNAVIQGYQYAMGEVQKAATAAKAASSVATFG